MWARDTKIVRVVTSALRKRVTMIELVGVGNERHALHPRKIKTMRPQSKAKPSIYGLWVGR